MAQEPADGSVFGSREDHAEAWRVLARAIAARASEVSAEPPVSPPERPGELTIIGSGIETVGFALGDDEILRRADKVFYCVADPATIVWIRRIRPDAYDLYVLYDDSKPRYVTYTQMAEAVLHFVREGARVACVFYGHPGIFVLASHRAVQIARREGHVAVMRPAVSALDCLCADLGVDPGTPGLQTFEASDLLLRQRKPDLTAHVVLWQVGLIGEMGYRREGYINPNFSIFIEYLQGFYGADYPVTHYIASRYPTIPPLIETQPLSSLHDPAVALKVNGLSTFYLAPRERARTDADLARRLGLLKPGQTLTETSSPLRVIDAYGPRERLAFRDFARFEAPLEYHWQEPNGASDFLIELRQSEELRQLYAAAPERALRDTRASTLTPEERRLLATRDSGAIQVAAKGSQRKAVSNEALLGALLLDRSACVGLLKARRANPAFDVDAWLAGYASAHGHDYQPSNLVGDLTRLRRYSLAPWTGVYATQDLGVRVVMVSSRDGRKGLLYVNGERIGRFGHRHGALQWRACAANSTNGLLRFDGGPSRRRIFGYVWPGAAERPDSPLWEASDVNPDAARLNPLVERYLGGAGDDELAGAYRLRWRAGGRLSEGSLRIAADSVDLDGASLRPIKIGAGRLNAGGEAGGLALQFLANPFTGCPECVGEITLGSGERAACYGGRLDWSDGRRPGETDLPAVVVDDLAGICRAPMRQGPVFLWQAWERTYLTSRFVAALPAWLRRPREDARAE